MEHTLHLATNHFIEEVVPTPASVLIRNKEDDDDEVTDFNVADTVGKALALVGQVSLCLV
jgi:hypothetical protein